MQAAAVCRLGAAGPWASVTGRGARGAGGGGGRRAAGVSGGVRAAVPSEGRDSEVGGGGGGTGDVEVPKPARKRAALGMAAAAVADAAAAPTPAPAAPRAAAAVPAAPKKRSVRRLKNNANANAAIENAARKLYVGPVRYCPPLHRHAYRALFS